jgi:hypothetical protein
MTWALRAGKKSIPWQGSRTFGRDDFPSAPKLSRAHFELREHEGHVVLRDLKSRNGTSYLGEKLKADQEVPLELDSEFVAGGMTFRLEEFDFSGRVRMIDAAVFAFSVLIVFADPSLKFGWTVGLKGVLILLAGCLVSFLPSSLGLSWLLFERLQRVNLRGQLAYAGLVAVFSMGLYHFVMSFADYEWRIADELVASKIEYFCVNHFSGPMCVKEINLCPRCPQRLPGLEREKAAQYLRGFRDNYEKRRPASR